MRDGAFIRATIGCPWCAPQDVPYLDLASHMREREPRADVDDRISVCSLDSSVSQVTVTAGRRVAFFIVERRAEIALF